MPEDIQIAETQLEKFVRESIQPTSPLSAINELKSIGISEENARAAIWFLIDRDRLRLTDDRKLALSGRVSQSVLN